MTPEGEPKTTVTSSNKSPETSQARDPRLSFFDPKNRADECKELGQIGTELPSIVTGEDLDYDPSWANDPASDGPFEDA